MSKFSAPFTVAVITTLLLATIVIVIITLSPEPSNQLIKINVVGIEAPICGSVTSEFTLSGDLNITGKSVADTENEAIELAKQNLSAQHQKAEASADGGLRCGRGCVGDEIICKWSGVTCDASEESYGTWKATCDGAVTCNKTCS